MSREKLLTFRNKTRHTLKLKVFHSTDLRKVWDSKVRSGTEASYTRGGFFTSRSLNESKSSFNVQVELPLDGGGKIKQVLQSVPRYTVLNINPNLADNWNIVYSATPSLERSESLMRVSERNPLINLVETNDIEGLLKYLETCTPDDINFRDGSSLNTALHIACIECANLNDKIIPALLRHDAIRVNLKNTDGNTPLHFLCAKWHLPNIDDKNSPFAMLIQKGAPVDAVNKIGETPLFKAIFNNIVRTMLMEGLIDAGADVNHLNERGEGVLHYAARMGRFDLVRIIVQAGSKLSVKGLEGKTPLDLAKEYSYDKIPQYLENAEALYRWLESLDLANLAPTLYKNEITLELMEDIDSDSLSRMGIPAPHWKKILNARSELRAMLSEVNILEEDHKFDLDSITRCISQDKIIPVKDLEYTKKLGSGAAGDVYKALFKGKTVAVKVLKSQEQKDFEEFKDEFYVMSGINNKHLVYFIGVSLRPSLCLIMEFCSRGSLYHLLKNPEVTVHWKRVFSFCRQMGQGLKALHTNIPQVLHRDIKSLNLLITRDWKLKVGDFGTSRFLQSDGMATMKNIKGTIQYIDPLMVQGGTWTDKSDVYSMGIVLWEIINRCISGTYAQPFYDVKVDFGFQILYKALENLRPTIPAMCPEPMQILIKSCWDLDANVRPTAVEFLNKLKEVKDKYLRNVEKWDKVLQKEETGVDKVVS